MSGLSAILKTLPDDAPDKQLVTIEGKIIQHVDDSVLWQANEAVEANPLRPARLFRVGEKDYQGGEGQRDRKP